MSFHFAQDVPSANQINSQGIQGLVIVPEPTAALLGGFGLLTLLRRRR